jgi:hypothetical protein
MGSVSIRHAYAEIRPSLHRGRSGGGFGYVKMALSTRRFNTLFYAI